jgi:hypothetical protein
MNYFNELWERRLSRGTLRVLACLAFIIAITWAGFGIWLQVLIVADHFKFEEIGLKELASHQCRVHGFPDYMGLSLIGGLGDVRRYVQ